MTWAAWAPAVLYLQDALDVVQENAEKRGGCQKAAMVGACYLARTADMNACRVARVALAVVTKLMMAGDVEDVSEDDWEDDDEGLWKGFAMSALDGLGIDVVDVAAVEDSALGLKGVDDREGKDFTTSVFTAGMAVGDEDNGAKASSIDPNATDAKSNS
ncbi:uncharacterized protein EDB91DRAFT_1084501 [Suillus paluster]|uniref:uncharacterized protein n=1 Tax=Suillus paluster TaxID=48578 RepID=UPI001B86D742|nr:uncharacterized protein EDB91DRAFT_1084501 [Suillus paluster]KAG1733224.1 hypothetical protein EDB91DRAFT_1084501 [Suillus paluster]